MSVLLLASCAAAEPGQPDSPDTPDGIEDPGDRIAGAPVAEGTDAARGILRVANWATAEELASAAEVHLYPKPAARIAAYRLGPDGAAGTGDDRVIATLAELDAIPWVGAGSFQRLLAYARAHGFDAPPACEASAARADRARLFVSPDDGDAPVLDLLAAARSTIDVVIYQLRSREAIDALAAAAARGVRVRVILDRQQDDNPGLVTSLAGRGIEARLSSASFTYTHQKTILVDDRQALVYTGNLDFLSFERGRNFGIVERDWQDVEDLRQLFEADWNGGAADLSCTRLVVSPVNSHDRVRALIDGARTSLDVEALYLTDRPLIDAVLAAHARGVAVRVLLNDPAFGFSDDSTGRELAGAGIPARRSESFFIHAKLLVVDGERVFLGSENFSRNSLDRNREVGVVLGAAEVDLARVHAVFEADFGAGVDF